MNIDTAIDLVKTELEKANKNHGPFVCHHQAYAVMLEEVDEYWDEVKKRKSQRDNENIKNELIQVAAMAFKAMVCLCE